MPFVRIDQPHEDRLDAAADEVEEVSKVVAGTLDTPIDRVRVMVSEVDPDLWGVGGVPYSVARGPVESPRPAGDQGL